VDPSILGTLFERGLDPDKRSQLGAHYTSREMIERIIDPVVRRPLLVEWSGIKASIVATLEPAQRVLEGALGRASQHAELVEEVREVRAKLLTRPQLELFDELKKQRRVRSVDLVRTDLRRAAEQLEKASREAEDLYRSFLFRLRAFRVLDPACGSGNFLYLALLALKDLEHQAMVEAEALGLQREFPQVGPEAVLGLEVNAYAAELARVSVWIGHIQWARRHGFPSPADPVLRNLDTIACRDAVVSEDGTAAAWPTADVIVGNPPFLGMKKQLRELGSDYTLQLRRNYNERIPAASDLACYWFEKARELVASGVTKRAGLVAPQNIRSGYSRVVLDRISTDSTIYEVWTNDLWPLDGASVRVSIICFGDAGATECRLDGAVVPLLNADLSSSKADLTTARRLPENAAVAFSGTVKGGKLDIPGSLARKWLVEPPNANGCSNSDVLAPWVNASDMTGRARDMWIIDFGNGRSQGDAAYYAMPFAYATNVVKPEKEKSTKYGARWWLLSEWCPGLRRALAPLTRYIATPTGSSHRVFLWLDARIQPDHQLVAIARDDDTTLGILHSKLHELWTRRLSSSLGVGDDPRYNPATAFETFPFPEGLTPHVSAGAFASDPNAQRIAQATLSLMAARDRWLNPSALVERVPEVVEGFPERLVPKDATSAVALRSRTLTALYNQRGKPEGAWLDALHRELDDTVAAAYGLPLDLSDEDILAHLLALNHARAAPRS
jgi:type II restriction/modification system DNA methylase subunit YeeA